MKTLFQKPTGKSLLLALRNVVIFLILAGGIFYAVLPTVFANISLMATGSSVVQVNQMNWQVEVVEPLQSGQPVYFLICKQSTCTEQLPALEEVAKKNAKIHFVQVNPDDVAPIQELAVKVLKRVVYPSHLLVTKEQEPQAAGGVLSATEIQKMIDAVLGTSTQSSSQDSTVQHYVPQNIVELNSTNFRQFMEGLDSQTSVYLVACPRDLCDIQLPLVDKVAAAYAGKGIKFVYVVPFEEKGLAEWVAQFTNGRFAYPTHLFINSQGAVSGFIGLMPDSALGQFIDQGLAAQPSK